MKSTRDGQATSLGWRMLVHEVRCYVSDLPLSRPTTGDFFNEIKARADQHCWTALRRGIPSAVSSSLRCRYAQRTN